MVEQNEFLEIILTCDASRLRRPLEEEPSGMVPHSLALEQREVLAVNTSDMGPPLRPARGTFK